jgi:hypothetical protein
MTALPCTCGETEPHIIMRRRTFDGFDVCLWDDGAVTGALGYRLRGVPVRRPRTAEGVTLARTAGALLLGAVCLYNIGELGPVYAAAEKAARLDGLPGTMRSILREAKAGMHPTLTWTVLHADRDGNPRERVARLPRLRWPALIVWDFCGGPGSAHGRYVLMNSDRNGTCTVTGHAFRRLADLWAHLETINPPAYLETAR